MVKLVNHRLVLTKQTYNINPYNEAHGRQDITMVESQK